MFTNTIFIPIFLSSPIFASVIPLAEGRQRCKAGDACWPTIDTWNRFNDSISGQLIATRPSAAVCHVEDYNEGLCEIAKDNWTVSDWRTSQPGAYTAMLWEFGPTGQCFINSSIEAPCDQGYVPHYSVNATSVDDIQKAVKFADKHDILLAIKNTGHDHLGRSSGGDGLSIWTHNLKGTQWHNDFVPENAPSEVPGIPAVTIQAGEQWLDVYNAAAEQKRIVVGGHARTVGAAGGWLVGGGHSVWSNVYGLGIDNVLELHVVTTDAQHITLNQYTNTDHFWAIRGGGGCAFGIITSVVYKTHPEPSHIQVGFVQVNTTTPESLHAALTGSLKAIDTLTASGYTGYGYMSRFNEVSSAYPPGFGALIVKINGTNESLSTATSDFFALNSLSNVSAYALAIQDYPTWKSYIDTWLSDQNIAQNVIDASRLLTPSIVHNDTSLDALVDLMITHGAGFNFIGRVRNDTRAETAVHPSWAQSIAIVSLGENWTDETPVPEKRAKKESVIEQSRKLSKVFETEGGGGTYINEANPYEPEWESVFWGANYQRLLEIKNAIDPTGLFVCNRCVGGQLVFEP